MSGASDYVSSKKIASHLRELQDNIVEEAFGCRFVSKLRCCNCGHLSVTQEPLIDISLEIEDVDSLPAALESFTKIEKIKYFCERCKTQGPFEKYLLVYSAPSITALHLKRFKNNEIVVQKVDMLVSFPLELGMLLYTSKINNEEIKYDLYVVIVHFGSFISLAHYYSFIRCAPNEWCKFDDNRVVFVEEDFVLAIEAYIMFYAKRGTPWFSDYIQIHVPLIYETSMKHELNKTEDSDSHDQVYCEDQLQDVEIKLVCSSDEEFMDALHEGSHVSSMNETKRKLEDSPSRDD
ncbi:hypothetical protein H5410_041186 [Solanum commersonii]|uniref:USP domain-containing protein n=1 Tax=Solanum commersonii TaxID=4109 RepID=A0A9J5XU29_SOLCO|nr:hypothetical protein H5410_041186 [Solanum commersonii]